MVFDSVRHRIDGLEKNQRYAYVCWDVRHRIDGLEKWQGTKGIIKRIRTLSLYCQNTADTQASYYTLAKNISKRGQVFGRLLIWIQMTAH